MAHASSPARAASRPNVIARRIGRGASVSIPRSSPPPSPSRRGAGSAKVALPPSPRGVVARASENAHHGGRAATVVPRAAAASGEDSGAAADDAADADDAVAALDAAPAPGKVDSIGEAFDVVRASLSSSSVAPKGSNKKTLSLSLALVALVAIHVRDPGWGVWNVIRVVGSLILGSGLALKGYKSGSLDLSGALSAAAVGWGTLYAGVRFGVTLGVFFFASSAMTKVGADVKRKIDEHFVEGKEGGGRDWIQVAANGAVPTLLAMSYSFATGGPEYVLGYANAFETPLACAFIAYYGTCCGDTWGSELGVLSKKLPRLIINPGKKVQPGTNGGVTSLGLIASGLGGLAVGFAFYVSGLLVPLVTGNLSSAMQFLAQWPTLALGFLSGVFGSLLDSLLGATIQFSGYCSERKKMVSKPGPTVTKVSGLNFLSNSAVNFVTATAMALAVYYGVIFAGVPF